ncbi:MAG: hypothetical protein QM503_04290 [Bacteroidota bacterium]
MKARLKTVFIILICVFYGFAGGAQTAEQTVRDAATSINQKIENLHQLASHKKIFKAIDKLVEINKELNNEIIWGTFDQTYKEAKMANPYFSVFIKNDLPGQLNPQFWVDYEARCDRIMANQQESLKGLESMVQLNRLDQAMTYGSQLKTLYETFESAAENLGTANLPKFAYDLYGNMNDFIENYKKIEKASREGIDIEIFEMDINRMSSRARHSQNLYNDYKRYIQSNVIVINDFKANVDYINTLLGEAASGPLAKLSYSDIKYNWDYGPFQTDVEVACNDFGTYEISCGDFRSNYGAITTSAHKDWYLIEGNIKASDDAEKKAEFLTYHTDRWVEFLGVTDAIFNKTYQKNCGENAASKTSNKDKADTPAGKFAICNLKIDKNISDFGGGKKYVKINFGIVHKGGNFSTIINVVFDGKQITQSTRSKPHFPGYQSIEDMNVSFALPDNVTSGQHTVKLVVKVDSEFLSTTETIAINGSSVTQVTNNTPNVKSTSATFVKVDYTKNNTEQSNQNTNSWNNNNEKPKDPHENPKPDYNEPVINNHTEVKKSTGIFIQGNGWSAQKIKNNSSSLQNDISSATNSGKTPAGIYANDHEVVVYYIDDNPLGMTSWNLEWYDGVEALQVGISSNMEQGYFPMGISFTKNGKLYVLYIMSQLSATAWQLVESEMELNSVAHDLQPWLHENYVPVGITINNGMYYTLMAQLPDAHLANWTIEGYENNNYTIKQNVNAKASSGLIPFGYLQEDGVVNILYVGF